MYFLTVVTEKRRLLFGHIDDNEMTLSDVGKIVQEFMNDISKTFKGVEIVNSVIMPNHVHMILFNEKGVSVIEVMRYLKGVTARRCGILLKELKSWEKDFKLWQRSYYDVVIHNQHMLDYINNYINENPSRWNQDKMNHLSEDNKDEIMKDIKSLR